MHYYTQTEGGWSDASRPARPCSLGDAMTIFETLMIALTFGSLIVSLIGLVVVLVKNLKK